MLTQSFCIIGGGLTGMTSALILARNGHKVTLVEQSPRLGLTVRGFSRHGVYFDTGLHYTGGLSTNGIVSRYLRYLGLERLDVVPFREDGFDEIRFADTGKTLRLPVGYARMRDALCAEFPDEQAGILRYMEKAQAAFDQSSLLGLFLTSQAGASADAHESLSDFLAKNTENACLRATLSIHSLLYGVSPDETPFTQHAYVAASYFDSVHNFSGGGLALVNAMERRLDALGVTVLTGTKVTRLHCPDGKHLTHVELEDGTRIATDAAVCTTSPTALAQMGEHIFRPSYLEHLRTLEETCSANMLFGIAEKCPPCLDGRNVFLCPDADITRAFLRGKKPEDGPFFIASSPQAHGGDGPAGIVVLAPGFFSDVEAWEHSARHHRPEGYTAHKAHVMQRIQETLVALCPELAAVRFVEGATPLTMRDYLNIPRGGLYGSKHSIHQRSHVPMTRIANLLLAGQSVVAPGLMGVMISAFLSCGLLLGKNTLHEEVACS